MKEWYFETSGIIGELLEKKMKVMLYNGDKDLLCNWRGGLQVANFLKWRGTEEFKKQELAECIYGWCKRFDNLWFVRVKNAGHMMGMDQRKIGAQMFDDYIDWRPATSTY